MGNSLYVPKLLWDAAAAEWAAVDLRSANAERMPWPGWLNPADFPAPRYGPSQVVRFRVGGRWRPGRIVSATMSGGDRMQAPGEDLPRLSYAWGHGGDVQYVIEGQGGELYRDVPELRVRGANER